MQQLREQHRKALAAGDIQGLEAVQADLTRLMADEEKSSGNSKSL
jgi:hypothetical protein